MEIEYDATGLWKVTMSYLTAYAPEEMIVHVVACNAIRAGEMAMAYFSDEPKYSDVKSIEYVGETVIVARDSVISDYDRVMRPKEVKNEPGR